jgi:tetratricopeptide (TPR) repeat protein
MRHALSCLILGAVCLHTAPVFADDADALNQEGIDAFAAGDYVVAAEKFAEAYASEPDPVFRKSEAVAWFKAERCEPAIEAANAFLIEWEEGGDAVDEAESVIANCKIVLARDAMESESFDLAERLLFEAEDHARDDYTRDRISATRVDLAHARREAVAAPSDGGDEPPTKEVASSGPAEVSESAEPKETSNPAGPIGVISGATLVVSAGVWHVVTLLHTVPRLQAVADGGDFQEYERLARSVDTARWAVPALYAAGATTMGVGAWFWFRKNPDRSQTTGGPEVGVSFSVRF